VTDRATTGKQDSANLGVYGVQKWGQLYAAGAVSVGIFSTSTSRAIYGLGAHDLATGDFSSTAVSGRAEVGWRLPWTPQLSATPFAAVQFTQLWQNGFTESYMGLPGLGPLGLSYDAKTTYSLPTFLGAQFDTRHQLADGMLLLTYTRVSWVHEFNPNRDITATFIALPNAAFTVDGTHAAADALRVDIGLSIGVSSNVALFANFDGEFSNRGQSYAGKGGFKVSW